jgi:hypothetical protein
MVKRKGHPTTGDKSAGVGGVRYNSTLSLTSALEWGGWPTPRPGRFTPRERAPVPIVKEAVYASAGRIVWDGEISPSPGFHPRTVQPIASRHVAYFRHNPNAKLRSDAFHTRPAKHKRDQRQYVQNMSMGISLIQNS